MRKNILRGMMALVGLAIVSGCAYALYHVFRPQYAKETVPQAVDIQTVLEENRREEASALQNGRSELSTSSHQVGSKTSAKPSVSAGSSAQENSPSSAESSKTAPLPAELNLAMPFYTQAPFSNWDYPWQEACEEATSLLIANAYFGHHWTRDQFNDQILKLVAWENAYFGDYKHTTVAQTAEFLDKYFGLKTIIHEHPTFEDIQKILAQGHLIAMPFAGKLLGNPNYKNGGPIYHMMVVKGYKAGQKIITDDVGTRNGENYVYSWDVIEKAFHDYAEPIENGGQRLIEVLPPNG